MTPPGSILGVVELTEHCISELSAGFSDDAIQEAFCARFKHWVRPRDVWHMVGNQRACVVLKGVTTNAELKLAAAKLQRVFGQPHEHYGRKLKLAVNAGFAPYDDSQGMSRALQQASLALNQARKSSTLFEFYSPATAQDEDSRQELLHDIELALDSGQFQLYYQPKVHAGFRNLTGAEALIRWHRPDGRVAMPSEFIHEVEQTGLIKPLSWWVIKSAVARLARWPEDLGVAVNISPALLRDDQLLCVARDALDIHNVSPSRLTLEVTEQIMAQSQDAMLDQLAKLRALGLRIALDDFGTGFSSLAYFRNLPVDEIKIDQSFVMHMLQSDKDMAIVRAVIDLAHNFSMKVVAEGVYSNELAEQLAQMRCDILQGFAYDAPLPVEEFEMGYRIRQPDIRASQPEN